MSTDATSPSKLITIDVTEFTRNVVKHDDSHTVSGEGILDVLMMTATKHLQAQFEGNRIRKEDYATAYVQLYQVTLQAAMQAWLQKGIAERQLELLMKQIESEDAKKDLYRRQIEGFDEDFKQKILKICLDSWSVGFSVAKDSFEGDIPVPMTGVVINDLYNKWILPDLDMYKYKRSDSTLNGDSGEEGTSGTSL